MSHLPDFDLPAYLKRIGCDVVTARDLSALQDLHARHLERIPFENIDVFLGRPGTLELDTLQRKLVHEARGGYCFEQNGLFAAALRALGFSVHTLGARVRPPGATAPLPRTHMLLRVDLDGRGFAADVGFGGDGPLLPVALDGRSESMPPRLFPRGVRFGSVALDIGVRLARGGWRIKRAGGRGAGPVPARLVRHRPASGRVGFVGDVPDELAQQPHQALPRTIRILDLPAARRPEAAQLAHTARDHHDRSVRGQETGKHDRRALLDEM